jgi:transposase, IS5 family
MANSRRASFLPFGAPGLFDAFMQNLDGAAFETPRRRVGKRIAWRLFEPEMRRAVGREAKGPGGRPRFHPLLMFKGLVLQRLHALADDATSFQITDRQSFRAFLGLTAAAAVPAGQTIADFREVLVRDRGCERLFDLFLDHLQKQHGLGRAREGVRIDATFVEVPRQRNRRAVNARSKAGEVPAEFADNPKLAAHQDCAARWTQKNHQTFSGDKDPVKGDVADKLLLAGVITPASVHDSQQIEGLMQEGDQVVSADSAYRSAQITANLAGKHVAAQICEKGTRAAALTEEQKNSNRGKSRVRSRVEHVFAQMTGSMRALRQRGIGLERNDACIKLTNLVYNMLRFEQIKRLGIRYPRPAVA